MGVSRNSGSRNLRIYRDYTGMMGLLIRGYNRIMVRNARLENICWLTLSFRPAQNRRKNKQELLSEREELHVVEKRHVHRRAQPKNARLEDKLLGLVLENVLELGRCRDYNGEANGKPHGK